MADRNQENPEQEGLVVHDPEPLNYFSANRDYLQHDDRQREREHQLKIEELKLKQLELQHKLNEAGRQGIYERVRDIIVLFVSLLLIIPFLVFLGWVAINPNVPPEARSSVTLVLGTVLGLAASYIFKGIGRSSDKKSNGG